MKVDFAASERLLFDTNPNPLNLGGRVSLQKSRTHMLSYS